LKKLNSLSKKVSTPDPIVAIEASIKKRKSKKGESSEDESVEIIKAKPGGKRKHPEDDLIQTPPKKKSKIDNTENNKNPKKGKKGKNGKNRKVEITDVAESSEESASSSSDIYEDISKQKPAKHSDKIPQQPNKSLSKVLNNIRKQKRPRLVSNDRREPWSIREEENLEKGIAIYGVGNWAQILGSYKFNEKRNGNSLKDKWRNMVNKRKKRNSLQLLDLTKVPVPKKEEEDSEDFIRN